MATEEDQDQEDLKDFISPNEDVFSYFTLTAPSEKKKHGRFTVDAFTSYLLVFAVLFIQCMLLFCVFNKVINKNLKWQNGVMNTGKDWDLIGLTASGCSDGKSLCRSENVLDPKSLQMRRIFTCAPPTVQLIGRWDELDVNKDGIWSRDEVMNSRADLKCKYAVDPVEVFDVLILLLKTREQYIWLHPDVKSGKSIPYAYFTYTMGDIAMCGYRNEDMCGNLVKRGFFDAALKHGTVPRVGTSIRSALEYCHDLLDQGGFCERTLPSTYSTWKIESVQECKSPEYSQFVYEDPRSGQAKSLLQVDYDAREKYEMAQTPIFLCYKFCIIFLWILLVVSQTREVSKTLSWVLQIPTATQEQADEEMAKHAETKRLQRQRSSIKNDDIQTLSLRHRLALIIVTCVRIILLCILLYVGLSFLGKQTDYIGLLMDGVALIFIVEVEEIIYARVLRKEVRTEWEERDPIELKKIGLPGLSDRADITDLLWLLLVAVMAAAFLIYYTAVVVQPLFDALQCACLSQGESCREASTFSYSFWEQYWKNDVPSSIQAINELRATAR